MQQRLQIPIVLASWLVLAATDFAAAEEGSAEPTHSAAKTGFVSLFNGKDIDDWVQRGGVAKYTIEGDTIIGTSRPNTENTFLCTKREYADFILEVDLKVDDGLNSGIQIRSEVNDADAEIEVENSNGALVKKKITAGRVYGYQVEIDPSDRAYSGGIYDEARRGWLNDLAGEKNAAARAAFKRGEWNKYRIEAIGGSIKTWVNGVPAADLQDDMTARGFIGLQVHGIGNNQELIGKQVRWRNIMLQEVTRPE